jgi:hypothetical protein
MYIPSYDEFEQFNLAKERLTQRYREELEESPNNFDEVIDHLVVQQYDTWSRLLWRIANQNDFLDAAIELRELMRSMTLQVSELNAHRELTQPI